MPNAPHRERLCRAARACGLGEAELCVLNGGLPERPNPALARALLACPGCRSALEWEPDRARCAACSVVYGVTDGIPILLPTQTSDPHKEGQAAFFDAEDAEFEITRPHGTTQLYRALLAEKFRRSLDKLPLPPTDFTALAVCGGSGMDAEFLARSGASVISADISLGAARRARKRAERYGLDIFAVVADVEALPFRDRSVDLVYVHDGLHHLESPEKGLQEMLRTSHRAISVNEPARARSTMFATRIGLAEHYEEAGNFIARMKPQELAATVFLSGFEIVRNQRYAMVYRHVPGRLSRALSQPGLLTLTRSALRAFNAVASGAGNKFTLQAVRRPGTESG